jgi:hypothetical protein
MSHPFEPDRATDRATDRVGAPSSAPGERRTPDPADAPDHDVAARTSGGWRSPYLRAVRRAWRAAPRGSDPRGIALSLALRAYAKDGRARGAPVEALLRALDRLTHPALGDAPPEAAPVREWAGVEIIRAYYADG